MAVLIEPDGEAKREVVLWMSHLDGSAQQTLPMLARFAAAGHPAVSFDAVGHGARSSGDPWAFAAHVLAAFRRRMGPILGQTRLEAMRISCPGLRSRQVVPGTPWPVACPWAAT